LLRKGSKIDPDKIDGIAYVIAKSIGAHGVKGKFFLDNLIKELFDILIKDIDSNLDNELQKLANS
jgi:hypothetical protein